MILESPLKNEIYLQMNFIFKNANEDIYVDEMHLDLNSKGNS